jgi:hypothetical protein
LLTDAEINVFRLRKSNAQVPLFEKRRLMKIREFCELHGVEVKHAPGCLNAADSISRGLVGGEREVDEHKTAMIKSVVENDRGDESSDDECGELVMNLEVSDDLYNLNDVDWLKQLRLSVECDEGEIGMILRCCEKNTRCGNKRISRVARGFALRERKSVRLVRA